MSDDLRIISVDYYQTDPKSRRRQADRYRVTLKLSRRITRFERELIEDHSTANPAYVEIQNGGLSDTLGITASTLEDVEPQLPAIRAWLGELMEQAARNEKIAAQAAAESAAEAVAERRAQDAVRDRINAQLNQAG